MLMPLCLMLMPVCCSLLSCVLFVYTHALMCYDVGMDKIIERLIAIERRLARIEEKLNDLVYVEGDDDDVNQGPYGRERDVNEVL